MSIIPPPKLNPQQMAAVTYLDGPLLVLAGAGSGKTRVITQKIVYLIDGCGYSPKSIVALTFTNKAANEMRSRVAETLALNRRRGLKVATFHTLGLQIIKRDLAHCGLRAGFSIFDAEDCQQLLRSFLPANKAQEREFVLHIQAEISHWKNELLGPDEVTDKPAEMVLLYQRYQQALRAYNAVDFDDLILMPVQLLQRHPEVKTYWQEKIRHLLIDEYQDSNTSQYALLRLLTGLRAQFTVVGDDDQSIYAWRGARPENLAHLQQDYPSLKVIKLEQNYRSTTRILHVANTLIANNPHLFEKKLWSALGTGDPLRVLYCKNEQDEALQVVTDLMSHKLRNGKQYGDYAILYRGNHQSHLFEKMLHQYGINYRLSGGQSWFAKAEIKDIFAYLRLLCNDKDDAGFLRAVRTPKRGIGDNSLEALGSYAEKQQKSLFECASHIALESLLTDKPRAALSTFKSWIDRLKARLSVEPPLPVLQEMVQDSGYEAHVYEQHDSPVKAQKCLENVADLLAWVGRLLEKDPSQTLADVVNKLIVIDLIEQAEEESGDSVQLMTLHASKGLEFPYVYLVGMEEDLLPHRVSIETDQIEEERRLTYVGITRAQKDLCFSLVKQRRRAGEWQDCQASRFLDELPQDCLEWYGRAGDKNEEKSKHLAKSHLQSLKEMLEQ